MAHANPKDPRHIAPRQDHLHFSPKIFAVATFVLRLKAPRPAFAQTLTDEERAIMGVMLLIGDLGSSAARWLSSARC